MPGDGAQDLGQLAGLSPAGIGIVAAERDETPRPGSPSHRDLGPPDVRFQEGGQPGPRPDPRTGANLRVANVIDTTGCLGDALRTFCGEASLKPATIGLLLGLVLGCEENRQPIEGRTSDPVTEEGFLEGAAGARLHYRIMGTGADTVVVVHGGPGAGMGTMIPDLEPLAEDHVLIFYDQRGGGLSSLPADTALLHARFFVDDLEAVRQRFGIQRMNVLAHSFGPIIVARYAMEHPESLRRLVFTGATGPRREDAARLAQAAPHGADPALQEGIARAIEHLMSDTLSDPVGGCREYERLSREQGLRLGDPGAWDGTSCDMPPEAVRYYFQRTARTTPQSFGDWDFTTRLGDLEAPLLVVWGYVGEPDSLAVAVQRDWAAAVPHGRLLLVPGAEKAGYAARPDIVVPAIEEFIAGRWPAGAEEVP